MPQTIQCNIVGFGQRPATLFSIFDEESGVLVISAVAPRYLATRQNGAILLTNDAHLKDRDTLFSADEHLGDAVAAYGEMDGSIKCLAYAPGLERTQPALEKDGYDASGPKWRINPEIKAEQVAVLVTCWHVRTVGQHVDQALGMMDELAAILAGRVVSI